MYRYNMDKWAKWS